MLRAPSAKSLQTAVQVLPQGRGSPALDTRLTRRRACVGPCEAQLLACEAAPVQPQGLQSCSAMPGLHRSCLSTCSLQGASMLFQIS